MESIDRRRHSLIACVVVTLTDQVAPAELGSAVYSQLGAAPGTYMLS